MSSLRPRLALGVALPALLCAAIGLTHPMALGPSTAEYWRNLHLALIPLFPLVGIAPWLIARRISRRTGWVAAIFGYGFATGYTALDILAGVGGGAMVMGGQADATGPLFAVARQLAIFGVVSLALAVGVAGLAVLRRADARGIRGPRLLAIAGTVLGLVGAALIEPGHIYFPVGTAALALFAGWMTLLAVAVTHPALVSVGKAPTASD